MIHAGFSATATARPAEHRAVGDDRARLPRQSAAHGGLLCRVDGEPAGALLFDDAGYGAGDARVSVVPALPGARRGVAHGRGGRGGRGRSGLRRHIAGGANRAARHGGVLGAPRATRDRAQRHHLALGKALPLEVGAARCRRHAARSARPRRHVPRRGDLVLLTGELGAGKTTLTQGIGAGLGVRGDVTSPTFVIARVHPSLSRAGAGACGRLPARRRGRARRPRPRRFVDDAVTVVEWGEGIAEALSEHRLR